MVIYFDADAMNVLSRATMTNAISYTDSYVNKYYIATNFSPAHILLFCVLSTYYKRICYVITNSVIISVVDFKILILYCSV